jgi:very-short-patch-repair endonuclease
MPIESEVDPVSDAQLRTGSAEALIAELAGHQDGVVDRGQLLRAGLGHGVIDRRVTRGSLHVIHRGVYAVGHAVLSRRGRWRAAVLAAGPGAVLSHRSAATLWGIRDRDGRDVDVIAPRDRKRPGIRLRRIVLPADEVTSHHGIPVTTPARTLLDLAEVLDRHQLERAMNETEYRRLTSPLSLDALLTRHRGRRGTAALKKIVDQGRLGKTITRSELEEHFLAFLDARELPRPLVNEPIGPYTVDTLWPESRLVVELDGRGAHETTRAFEEDRRRDRDLVTKGYRVIRITWRQLHSDGAAIATQLRTLLLLAAA